MSVVHTPLAGDNPYAMLSRWTRFWHEPVGAERMAWTRIFVALTLLADQLLQYLPALELLFGPDGFAYDSLHDAGLLRSWRWTILVFYTDNLLVVRVLFVLWMAATVAFLLGWHSREANVAVWFLSICFVNRNPHANNGGDDVLTTTLFLLMFMPTGVVLSLDRIRKNRRQRWQPGSVDRPKVAPWSVRVLQIQLCVIYCTTGLAKLSGIYLADDCAWWNGTAIYYVLNDITLARVSWLDLPIPYWATVIMTYTSVWWETLFPVLVLSRRLRLWMLLFGVLFHLGIFLAVEVSWFSFYTLALYGAWIERSRS